MLLPECSLPWRLLYRLAHTRKGVTRIYARWEKFDLRRGAGSGDRAVAARDVGRRADSGDQDHRIDESPQQHDEEGGPLRPPGVPGGSQRQQDQKDSGLAQAKLKRRVAGNARLVAQTKHHVR